MKMSRKLANDLMDALACVAICANERTPDNLTEDEVAEVEEWSRTTFCSILDAFEDEDNKWIILDE